MCRALNFKLPLKPSFVPFFITILMIPAIPSGSYLADGEVITSTFSICEPEILANSNRAFLPSISILTFEFPLKETSPSWSTLTKGVLESTSSADPFDAIISLSGLYTILSAWNSYASLCCVIDTSWDSIDYIFNEIVPKSLLIILSVIIIKSDSHVSKPINEIATL